MIESLKSLGARGAWLALAAGVVALDQATKIWAHTRLRGSSPLEIVPGFVELVYSRNSGGLFGAFAGWETPWRWILLTFLPSLAVALILHFIGSTDSGDRGTLTSLSLILGGAVGNLLDRLFRGAVVDFIDVYAPPSGLANWLVDRFGTAHWPTFNVADSCIVAGSMLLLLMAFRPVKEAAPASAADTSPE